jgi:hypothetical protein
MKDAFRMLQKQDDLRICLFIDGLDEYEGDRDGSYVDILTLFAEIATSANIKICMSSRPWLVFEDAFRQYPSLRLQDTTSDDIRQYVKDNLNNHDRMVKLRKHNPREAENLVNEIVSKASGVFLWVKLVVESLLDGLTNRDRISDLQKRLRQLPADLEDLYKHMLLKHIDPFYYEQSSQIFQIFRAAKDSVRGTSEGVDLLTLTLADEEDQNLALTADIKAMTKDLLVAKCSDMMDRLKSRCAGLLEVSGTLSMNPLDMRVDFLHRTVRNFLEIPEIWQLQLALPGHTFDPNECLAKSYLLQLKMSPVLHPGLLVRDDFKEPYRIATLALECFRKSRDMTGAANLQLLDELDSTMQCLWTSRPRRTFDMNSHAIDVRYNYCWACYAERRHKANEDFLSVAVSLGLKEYVDAKLKTQDCLFKSHVSLLHSVVEAPYPPEPEMVSLLLQRGDPNKKLGGQSMWQIAVSKLAKPVTSMKLSGDPSLKDTWVKICKLLVENGADCNAICLVRVEKDYSDVVTGFDSRRFQVRAFTPLSLFSPTGLYPNTDLEALLIARGAVSISTKSESYDREEAEREAFQAAAEALFVPLHAQQAEEKLATKKNKLGLWRRKWMSF